MGDKILVGGKKSKRFKKSKRYGKNIAKFKSCSGTLSKWNSNFRILVHLSEIVMRPISVVANGRKLIEIGQTTGQNEVKRKKIIINSKSMSRMVANTHPDIVEIISKQTGITASKLWKLLQKKLETVERLKISQKTRSSYKKLPSKSTKTRNDRYTGQCLHDAGKLLDLSQSEESDSALGRKGHPRGHAYHPDPNSKDPRGCVQNYSKVFPGQEKTAFLSFKEQDSVAHAALCTQAAAQSIKELNRGVSQVSLEVSSSKFRTALNWTPKMKIWKDGHSDDKEIEIQSVKLVMRRFRRRSLRARLDNQPLIYTFYPLKNRSFKMSRKYKSRK